MRLLVTHYYPIIYDYNPVFCVQGAFMIKKKKEQLTRIAVDKIN